MPTGYPFPQIQVAGNSIVIDGGRDDWNDPYDGSDYESQVYNILEHIAYRSRSRVGNLIVLGVVSQACGVADRGALIWNPRHAIHNAWTRMSTRSEPIGRRGNPLFRARSGARSSIEYWPWEYSLIGTGRPGHACDESLLHEMVHAYLGQRGLSSAFDLNREADLPESVQNFDIVDDFYAIMITNVYASECGRVARRDHAGYHPLNRTAQQVRDDPHFAPFFDILARALPDLTRALASVNTAFNPWRCTPTPRAPAVDDTGW